MQMTADDYDAIPYQPYRSDSMELEYSSGMEMAAEDIRSKPSMSTRSRSRKDSSAPHQHSTTTKAFSCPTCGGQFSRQAILNEHIRAEHYQERVKCTICGMPFKRQNDRRRHETFQHLRKRAFQCKNGDFGCGKRFTRMDSLREHQANPKKAGTTCEQAMLFAKHNTSPQPPPPPQQQRPQPQMMRVSESESSFMSATTMQPVLPLSSSPSPSTTATSMATPSSSASQAPVLMASQEPRSWLDWQMQVPPQHRRNLDPGMMPTAHIPWQVAPDARFRHITTTADITAPLTAGLSLPDMVVPMQCMVGPPQDFIWSDPEANMFDDSGIWTPWTWPRAGDLREEQEYPFRATHVGN